jgi:hypothetical protein
LVTPQGIATALADVSVQVVIACLVFFGPVSFQRYRFSVGVAVGLGALFALAYDGILLTQFFPALNPDFNVEWLFVITPLLAGFIAGYQTRRFSHGVIIAMWSLVIGTALWSVGWMLIAYGFWGTHGWYFFWQNDGAIDEFRQSGGGDLNVFILSDMQGALFFHPLLSVFSGAIFGLVASGLAQGALALQRLGRVAAS